MKGMVAIERSGRAKTQGESRVGGLLLLATQRNLLSGDLPLILPNLLSSMSSVSP